MSPTASLAARYVDGVRLDGAEIEKWVIEFTNDERLLRGIPPLKHDPRISSIARAHSKNMAKLNSYEHVLYNRNPTDRAEDAGFSCRYYFADGSSVPYSGLSENIFEYYRVHGYVSVGGGPYEPTEYDKDSKEVARGLVGGWMDSPGHRQNILDEDSQWIGVGVYVHEIQESGYKYITEVVAATQNFSPCGP